MGYKSETYIRLREIGNKKKKFTFPANPEKISGSMGAKHQSFEIISKGAVKVPKGTDVTTLKWNGVFFGEAKRNEAVVLKDYYQLPNACIKQLHEWMEKGTPLNVIVTDTWINIDVTISSFQPENYGAFGNVAYSIELCQHKELKIYTTNELSQVKATKTTVARNEGSSSNTGGTSYTIVSGDTLWGIARKKLGSGLKWTKIYQDNKEVIEAAAKARGFSSSDGGNRIWPGTTISIAA